MPFHVYVIRLRTEILAVPKIARANPDHVLHKPCVYVGSSALTPDERYGRHIDPKSRTASKWVREYHIGLHKRLTARQPEFDTRDEAEKHEKWLAERLRRRGYAVWSK